MRAVISVVTQRFHLTCDAPPLLRIDCCDLHSSCLFCSFVLTQRLLCLALFSSVLLFPVCSVIVVSFIPFIIRLCAFCQVVVVFCFVYYSSCLTHFTPLDLLSLWDRDRLGSCWSTSVIRSRYPFIVFFFFLELDSVHYIQRTFALPRCTSLSSVSSSYLPLLLLGVKDPVDRTFHVIEFQEMETGTKMYFRKYKKCTSV